MWRRRGCEVERGKTSMRLLNGMRLARYLAGGVAVLLAATAAAAEFPFERELLLEAKPLPGSKRVPMLEITRDGRVVIDLWCRSGEGRVKIEDDMIELTLGAMREEGCTPERAQRDEALAAALGKVMNWSMEDDVLVLSGPTELRYTLSSH
jgi:heat shock protein HslJ